MRKRIEKHPAVKELWNAGEDGWWATLNEGWRDTESGLTCVHEWTLKDVWQKLSDCKKEATK